ncbi:hypothetical protein DIPPA_27589 [Diplonema papillatum]|nr:hypothetical protein DIPPA_27589 [Diplonema papillatum]
MFICFFDGGFAVAGVRAGAAGFGAAFTSAAFGAVTTTLGVLRGDCTGAVGGLGASSCCRGAAAGELRLRFGGLRGFVEAQALPGHFGDQRRV